MEPAKQGWMGLALFVGGLLMVGAGGWLFETVHVAGRGVLLAGGYFTTLCGIVNIVVGVVRSEKR